MREIEKLTDAEIAKQLAAIKAKVVECARRHLALADEQKQYIAAMVPFSLEQERRHLAHTAGKTGLQIKQETIQKSKR